MDDKTPIKEAMIPMDSGLDATDLAEAAGIISNAMIKSTPPNLKEGRKKITKWFFYFVNPKRAKRKTTKN